MEPPGRGLTFPKVRVPRPASWRCPSEKEGCGRWAFSDCPRRSQGAGVLRPDSQGQASFRLPDLGDTPQRRRQAKRSVQGWITKRGATPSFLSQAREESPRPEGKGLSAVPRRGGAALNRRSGRTKPEHGWCKKGYRETPASRRDGVPLMPSIKEQPKPQVRSGCCGEQRMPYGRDTRSAGGGYPSFFFLALSQ